MNEVQPLINSILEEANREAERIREEGRSDAMTLQKRLQAKAEDRRAELLREAERKAQEEKSRRKIQAQLAMRRELLEVKSQLIAEVFATVQNRLTQMEDGAYRRFIKKLILQAVQTGEEELVLSTKDRARLGDDFLKEVNGEIKKSGLKGKLVLAEADSSLPSGFLLRRGKVVHNYSLANLVDAQREELLPEIGKRLFAK